MNADLAIYINMLDVPGQCKSVALMLGDINWISVVLPKRMRRSQISCVHRHQKQSKKLTEHTHSYCTEPKILTFYDDM